MAGLEARVPAQFGRGQPAAPRRARRRRSVPPERPAGNAAQTRRRGSAGPGRGPLAQRGHLRGLRALLPRRHRRGDRARKPRARRAVHRIRSGQLAGAHRNAGQHPLPGHRRVQTHHLGAGPGHASGPEHPGRLRPQGDGLQQRQLHSHPVPGHEPGLCGSRFLLRRPLLPPRGTCRRSAVQSLRPPASRPDRSGEEQSRGAARRPLPLPGRRESVQRSAQSLAGDPPEYRCAGRQGFSAGQADEPR